ncbi:MAG: (2Fe-2S)-binding protein [Deltaproteobacteria bacterium]|nr:(2Fe-2S)-binding protein [Deltaproteobacteria bacterium]
MTASQPEPQSLDGLICFCHGVLETEIRKAIAAGAATVAAVQEKTRASTGCGGCMPEVERLIAEMLQSKTD